MRIVQNYRFHVNLFAESREEGFTCTWEDAATLLEQLPRMIFEPDGSFVVSSGVERTKASRVVPDPGISSTLWHVNGHLFDFAGRLHRLELHGQCPPESFDALLRCVGWPAQPLLFEMVREGVTVDEPTFRSRAAS